ncbi:Hypothetical protein SSCIU_02052 [Mammaliicoccus sciuri]|nr:Hypothetical protein SSCIU_02052 [Mammaliicoccus sciuri]
MIIVQL